MNYTCKVNKHTITTRSGTYISSLYPYFIMESCRVQAETDYEEKVEKIRAQSVEQSDLLVYAERTNLPLSAAEKPSSYF